MRAEGWIAPAMQPVALALCSYVAHSWLQGVPPPLLRRPPPCRWQVDGMDVLAVKHAVAYSKEYAIKNGPIVSGL